MVGTPPEKRPVHTVFQTYALFPHMTVADNIAFPLKMAGKASPEIKARVSEALDGVRLSDFGDRFPHELSGGQKQRVALAEAWSTGHGCYCWMSLWAHWMQNCAKKCRSSLSISKRK